MFKASTLLFVLVFAGCATASHSIDRLPASSSGGDVGDRGRNAPAEKLLQEFVNSYQATCSDGYARISTWRGDTRLAMGGITWAGGDPGKSFEKISPAKYVVRYSTDKLSNGEIYAYEVRATAYTRQQVRLEARFEITDPAGRKTSASAFSLMAKSEFSRRLTFGDKVMEVAINGPVPDSIMDTNDEGRAMIKELQLKDGDEVQESILCSILSK